MARLPADQVGMIVDRGHDFPESIQQQLDEYGRDLWIFRDDASRATTRSLNSYRGEFRGFEYLTPRVRLTPADLQDTIFQRPRCLHFICSPARASTIVAEVEAVSEWSPITIYEPIPMRTCRTPSTHQGSPIHISFESKRRGSIVLTFNNLSGYKGNSGRGLQEIPRHRSGFEQHRSRYYTVWRYGCVCGIKHSTREVDRRVLV